jgi:hypothetical protein
VEEQQHTTEFYTAAGETLGTIPNDTSYITENATKPNTFSVENITEKFEEIVETMGQKAKIAMSVVGVILLLGLVFFIWKRYASTITSTATSFSSGIQQKLASMRSPVAKGGDNIIPSWADSDIL